MRSEITLRCGIVLGCGAALFMSAQAALGQAVVNFDENGNGTILTAAGGIQPLQSLGNQTDPFDPNNGLKPLIYQLPFLVPGAAPTPGDIDLLEPGAATGNPSDLLRWAPNSAGELLIVYSDPAEAGEAPDLADVGVPTARQQNVIRLTESGPEGGLNGLFGYAPVTGQPGGIGAAAPAVIYNFTSDTVPEPASLGLLGAGGALLLRRRRSAAA